MQHYSLQFQRRNTGEEECRGKRPGFGCIVIPVRSNEVLTSVDHQTYARISLAKRQQVTPGHAFDSDNQLAVLTWRPGKTLRTTGKSLSIPVLPSLQAALDATHKTDVPETDVLTFLTTDYGRPFKSAAAFGNKFADWCVAAGLQPVECDDGKTRNFRAHGLRKAALYTLYKLGGNVAQLQALGGHGSIAELQKYIQEIEQDEQAVSGMALVAAAQAKRRTGSD
jgi:integrase/recombinase XerD